MNPRAKRRWTPLVMGVVTAILCAVATAAVQSPAHAALPGAAIRSEQSAFNSTPTRSIAARCPEGTRVTGGAGRVDGIPGHVVLTTMRPVRTNDVDRFEVAAAEDQTGTDAEWAVTAIAICASPIAGIHIVEVTRAGGDSLDNFVRATCPTGETRLSGGGQITGGNGQVHLAHTGSAFGADALAQGLEDPDGFAGAWTVTAFAVCIPTPQPGTFRVVQESSGVDSISPKVVSAVCPAGMSVVGAAGVSFGNGNRNPVVQSVAPSALPGGRPGNEVTAVVRENNPIGGSWNVRAVAYCHS